MLIHQTCITYTILPVKAVWTNTGGTSVSPFFGGKTTSKIRNDELSKNENIHNMLTEVIV